MGDIFRAIGYGLIAYVLLTNLGRSQVSTTNPTMKVLVGTVATAPTCNAASEGTFYGVTDALAPTVLAAVVGGGAVHTLTYCNGTSWIVG